MPDDIVAALNDPQIVALTLYGETRGEAVEGQVAVGCVIRNRVRLGRWGPTYARVCLAPWQFSCWTPQGGRENHAVVMKAAETLARSTTLPDDTLLRQCIWVAQGIIGDWIRDQVKGATHYYSPSAMVPAGAVPKWAVGHSPVVEKGRHLFFVGIK